MARFGGPLYTLLMTITICGSMQFHKRMRDIQKKLEELEHKVLVPSAAIDESLLDSNEEKIATKIEHDLIREHFRNIQNSHAILVVNYDKNGIKNYIGGNTFLEMGYAFSLYRGIFLLNPIPDMRYQTEMHAMQPIVIHGDVTKVKA